MNVYLVHETWGQHSDHEERIDGVFATEKAAEAFVQTQLIPVYKDEYGKVCAWYIWESDEQTYEIAPEKSEPSFPYDSGRVCSDWHYKCERSYDTSHFQIIEMEVRE